MVTSETLFEEAQAVVVVVVVTPASINVVVVMETEILPWLGPDDVGRTPTTVGGLADVAEVLVVLLFTNVDNTAAVLLFLAMDNVVVETVLLVLIVKLGTTLLVLLTGEVITLNEEE